LREAILMHAELDDLTLKQEIRLLLKEALKAREKRK